MIVISTEEGIRVGDYGTLISAVIQDEDGTVVDLTTATSVVMRFRNPSGVGVDKATTVDDAVNGEVSYILESGVITEAGIWYIQLIPTFPSMKFYSNPESFEVFDPLPSP